MYFCQCHGRVSVGSHPQTLHNSHSHLTPQEGAGCGVLQSKCLKGGVDLRLGLSSCETEVSLPVTLLEVKFAHRRSGKKTGVLFPFLVFLLRGSITIYQIFERTANTAWALRQGVTARSSPADEVSLDYIHANTHISFLHAQTSRQCIHQRGGPPRHRKRSPRLSLRAGRLHRNI